MFLKKAYAHQGYIYLDKYTVKKTICEILLQFKMTIFYMKYINNIYILKCNLFLWCKADFQHQNHYMIFA